MCPTGTDSSQYAGYRACPCLDNYYRLDRFGPCQSCDRQGAQCKNDYKTVKSGFWWNMPWNQTAQNMYVQFTKNLLIRNDSYDEAYVNYTANMPTIHKCRRPKACPGQEGDASNPVCAKGSKGPLCELCHEGYFLAGNGCSECPPRWRAALQLVALIAAVLCLFIFFSWRQAGATLSDGYKQSHSQSGGKY